MSKLGNEKNEPSTLSAAGSDHGTWGKRRHHPKASPRAAGWGEGRTEKEARWQMGGEQTIFIILVLIQQDPRGLIISGEKHNLLILKSLKFEIPGAKD